MTEHRTLIRIEGLDPASGMLRVVVPGWSPLETVKVSAGSVPGYILDTEDLPIRCYARVNLDAETADCLRFSDWELR